MSSPPASQAPEPEREPTARALGLGLVTGAADDDPSAIGTYASAGAALGPAFLWTAPATFPMMFTVVYLSSKLGQVSGKGLFDVIRDHYPRWVLYPTLIGVLLGNAIEAAADLGGMAAAIQLLIPVPFVPLVVAVALAILALQIFGSYRLIRNVFRWLALVLCAYIGSALLAEPDLREVVAGTLIPTLRFDREFLTLLVAVIGTTLSAYLYTWQSNEEVEEEIEHGHTELAQRRGATRAELRRSQRDILVGTGFSNVIMYFVILATASTLFRAGHHQIDSAAAAAAALTPLAGRAAGLLFALGIVAVGFLAVPVMTAGASYDLCQTLGWKHGLYARFHEARRFYAIIIAFTALGVALNLIGINPMRALVVAAVIQGFSTPPLLLIIMLATNRREVMGDRVNGRALNLAGWATTALTFTATVCLVITWFL